MEISRPVRFGVLFLVGTLVFGLVWLGVARYRAEHSALQIVAQAQAEAAPGVAPEGASAVGTPAAAGQTPGGGTGSGEPQLKAAGAAGEEPSPSIVVHVVGAVVNPGVYRLEAGARVDDLIKLAGGTTPDGAADALNCARVLADGDKVWVPSKQEVASAASSPTATREATVTPVRTESSAPKAAASAGKVNINTAGIEELTAVNGIGPAIAKAIVEYRTKHGPFKQIDELDAVSGIGPKTLERLRPLLSL